MIVLDVETTGLYPSPPPSRTPDFIVAIGVLDNSGIHIFSAPHEAFTSLPLAVIEKGIIGKFENWFLNHETDTIPILSYNGISFDIPFISTKLLQSNEDSDYEFSNKLLNTPHIDLIDYARFVVGRRIGKDDACRKLANLYVPRKTEGLWNARIYKNPHLLTLNDHLEMLHHNAVDLTATARLYNVVKTFPDFKEWMEGGGNNDTSPGHVPD
jgi:DNA polymerase III epsilon subunit-like protein